MKRNIIYLLLPMLVVGQFSCKKFLDVTPVEKLSGNQYWSSGKDVDLFVNDIYGGLWDKFSGASFLPATGEQRLSEIRPTIGGRFNGSDGARRVIYNNLAKNDLKTVLQTGATFQWSVNAGGTANTTTTFNFTSITRWVEFYRAIQASNILYDNVKRGIPGFSPAQTNQYLGEAVFIRCFTYFTMVRLYGDVAYYTDANHATALPRENMVSVLNKCIADLKAVKDFLPWKYSDPALNGVRANRGGAIALLMNMNMWNAGFDQPNKALYCQATADLGSEIIKSVQYSLVPLSSFNEVMQGGTNEGLIELKQSVDYGSVFNKVAFPGEVMLTYPDKAFMDNNGTNSHAYYTEAYMRSLYQSDPSDQRISTWFDNIYSADGSFSLKKFKGQLAPQGFPDWGLIFSRYGDVVLLHAEALAELGSDAEAIASLNLIRARAGAKIYSPAEGDLLKDIIYIERCKELIGEGYHYFDLVRTGRILDPKWCTNPLTKDQFDRGAWTWPIDASALVRNPYMSLNQYWL